MDSTHALRQAIREMMDATDRMQRVLSSASGDWQDDQFDAFQGQMSELAGGSQELFSYAAQCLSDLYDFESNLRG